jgi:hypothetical protein
VQAADKSFDNVCAARQYLRYSKIMRYLLVVKVKVSTAATLCKRCAFSTVKALLHTISEVSDKSNWGQNIAKLNCEWGAE